MSGPPHIFSPSFASFSSRNLPTDTFFPPCFYHVGISRRTAKRTYQEGTRMCPQVWRTSLQAHPCLTSTLCPEWERPFSLSRPSPARESSRRRRPLRRLPGGECRTRRQGTSADEWKGRGGLELQGIKRERKKRNIKQSTLLVNAWLFTLCKEEGSSW